MPARKRFIKAFFIVVFCVLGAVYPTPIFSAVAPTFSNLPSSINSTNIIEVDVKYKGNPKYYANKTYYLRGVFYQSSGKYCSFTQNNNGDWINTGTDPTKLYQFQTNQEGSWSGKIKVKVDTDSNNFKGSGNYNFKVGRYTSGGSVSWSSGESINIQAPTISTPTPTSQSQEETGASETESVETEDEAPQEEPTGVVAGVSLGIKSSPSTFSSDLEIGDIVEATPSSDSASEATPSSDTKTSGKFTPFAIAGGGILTLAAIAPIILKKYNKDLWQKLFKKKSSVGGPPSSGQE